MYKLLVVDDEAIIREGIVNMISWEKLGIQLTASCADAFEALDSMVDEMPDILLSDIKMPKMDGLELIDRALKLYPSLQTIVLSGYDEFEFARKAIKLGVKEYLLKPCDKEELHDSLTRVCKILEDKRRKMNENIDERNLRIKALKEQLMILGMSGENKKQLEEKIVKLFCKECNEGILVESLVLLVAETSKKLPDSQRLMALIQSIYEQNSESMVGCTVQVLQQLYPAKGKYRGFVEEMCNYIQEHYMDQNLSLQFVADQVVHMNADYIGKEFAHDCGMKFSKYLLKVRIEHAKRIIASNVAMPFYEVAERTGYGDNPQYFSLMFKKICNMTPKEYRDQILDGRH